MARLKWWAEVWVSTHVLANDSALLPMLLKDFAPRESEKDSVTVDSWEEIERRQSEVKVRVFGFAKRKPDASPSL